MLIELDIFFLQDFVVLDLILLEFKCEILKYQVIEQDVENIEFFFRVGYGVIELFLGQIVCNKNFLFQVFYN